MFNTINIFDSTDPEQPLKSQIELHRLGSESSLRFYLNLHYLELSDGIYNPVGTSETISYLTLK